MSRINSIEDFKKNIIFEFPILHIGWELDNIGYIATDGDELIFCTTNHGGLYKANKSELEEKIKEYEEALEKSNLALKLLNTQDVILLNK